MTTWMALQDRVKRATKKHFFKDELVVRRIRGGPASGVNILLNRLQGLQVEFGLYESELHAIYRRVIHAGRYVWDIGAGDGYTGLLYANLGARVRAYEPDADALFLLDANLRLNPGLASRISVVRTVYVHEEEEELPSFAKIDVDGAEDDVLMALPRLPVVLTETHGRELEARCVKILNDRRYATRV